MWRALPTPTAACARASISSGWPAGRRTRASSSRSGPAPRRRGSPTRSARARYRRARSRSGSACPGEVVTGSPTRTCAKETAPASGATASHLIEIGLIGTLVDLDVGAPRIGDEGEPDAVALVLGRRHRRLDARRFRLLQELLDIVHVEADVVEHAALGGDGRLGGLAEGELRARDVGRLEVAARAERCAKQLAVPGLHVVDRGFRHEEVHVVMADRHLLVLVLED